MKRRRKNQKRERIIMFLSSVFVLTALTMTGVYVKERNKIKEEDYVVDLSQRPELEETQEDPEAGYRYSSDDDPNPAQVSSGKVQNPGKADETANRDRAVFSWEPEMAEGEEVSEAEENKEEAKQQKELVFPEGEALVWPVVGNVLINYSMDKPVYFASLEQYKMNPAIIIQATEGQQINAAAGGRVTKIAKEEETGNTIYMDIGSGYEAVYGQLTNISVKEGDMVEKGAYLADVAAPTKYYIVEGCNVYFALTKDGTPVDPLGRLE